MSRKKISTQVYLEPEQHEALQKINKQTRIAMAVIIREGVDWVVTKYKRRARAA